MRVVYGETIFVTVSPNRRHSSMILKMSRARRNDTSLKGNDPVTHARKKFCGKDVPRIFAYNCYSDDAQGEATVKEIPLPALWIRQACNAQDPIASCHHYLFSCVLSYLVSLDCVCASCVPTVMLKRACIRTRGTLTHVPITWDVTASSWEDMLV